MLLTIEWFLLSLFLFVRYFRAGKSGFLFLCGLFFLGWSFLESSLLLGRIVILVFAIIVCGVAILKEKKHPILAHLQKGYTTKEAIIHYACFGIVNFVVIILYIYAQ